MADVSEKVLQEAVENATETISGTKTPASPEGAAMAYGSLILMAMIPIFLGALRSVKHQKDQKVQMKLLSLVGAKPQAVYHCLLMSWHIVRGHFIKKIQPVFFIFRILAKSWNV